MSFPRHGEIFIDVALINIENERGKEDLDE